MAINGCRSEWAWSERVKLALIEVAALRFLADLFLTIGLFNEPHFREPLPAHPGLANR